MKIQAMSDTHMHFPKVQPSAYLIHCGDYESGFNDLNKAEEIADNFLSWLSKQHCQYKIFVPGNHDSLFWYDQEAFLKKASKFGIHVLNHEVVKIGKLTFFGSPYFYTHRRNQNNRLDIPAEPFDVLVTHTPPKGVMDWEPRRRENIGSQPLRDFINDRLDVKCHFFGHCHEGHGKAGGFHNVALASRTKNKILIHDPVIYEGGNLLC